MKCAAHSGQRIFLCLAKNGSNDIIKEKTKEESLWQDPEAADTAAAVAAEVSAEADSAAAITADITMSPWAAAGIFTGGVMSMWAAVAAAAFSAAR